MHAKLLNPREQLTTKLSDAIKVYSLLNINNFIFIQMVNVFCVMICHLILFFKNISYIYIISINKNIFLCISIFSYAFVKNEFDIVISRIPHPIIINYEILFMHVCHATGCGIGRAAGDAERDHVRPQRERPAGAGVRAREVRRDRAHGVRGQRRHLLRHHAHAGPRRAQVTFLYTT